MNVPFTIKEVDFIRPIRTLSHIEAIYGIYRRTEILNAINDIKPHKNKGKTGMTGGLECVLLIQKIAEIYRCQEATAFNIVQEASLLMGKPMVVSSKASYRNMKSKYGRRNLCRRG